MRVDPGRSATLGGNVYDTATLLPKTSGTIYALVQLHRPGDADHGKFWDTNSGGSWQAAGSVTTWPSATYAKGSWWTYTVPTGATDGKPGAIIKLADLTDNVATPASATVLAGGLESVEVSPVSREIIADLIESQRGTHAWGFDEVFYVDPVNGTTIAGGATGERHNPLSTVTEALSLVTDSRHSLIVLVPGASAGATTLTEAVTVNKRYTFIRGPGRDFIWTRSGDGDTVTITANGVELSGFQLATAPTGSGNCVTVSGADFAKLRHLWVNEPQGHGIAVLDSQHAIIKDSVIESAGQGGSGHGIVVDSNSGNSSHTFIRRCHVSDAQGDGIRLAGPTVADCIVTNNEVHGSTGYGINIGTDVVGALVSRNTLGNNASGDLLDNGTDTVRANNEQWAAGSSGARTVTVTVNDAAAQPVSSVVVDVYDETDKNRLWRAETNGSGVAQFNAPDGTYSIRLLKDLFTPDNVVETLVVDEDEAVTYTGTVWTAPLAADPSKCRVSGFLRDASGALLEGKTIRIWAAAPTAVPNNQLGISPVEITTDDAAGSTWGNGPGYFEVDLVRDASVRVQSRDAGVDDVRTVPDAASQDFATWVAA